MMARDFKVEVERDYVRLIIWHGEDEEVIRLGMSEAEDLSVRLMEAVEDYHERRKVRID